MPPDIVSQEHLFCSANMPIYRVYFYRFYVILWKIYTCVIQLVTRILYYVNLFLSNKNSRIIHAFARIPAEYAPITMFSNLLIQSKRPWFLSSSSTQIVHNPYIRWQSGQGLLIPPLISNSTNCLINVLLLMGNV